MISAPQQRPTVLRGRVTETAALAELLALARAGHGSALVLRGEPGIGKTTLLARASELADGFVKLSAEGVEFETELAFATLHQLCLPLVNRLDQLPEPHRDALTIAFGMRSGPAPTSFMVGAGLTSLLSEAAGGAPVLCVVDDAHWIDQASARALAFAARRIEADPVAVLFAARPSSAGHPFDSLPTLEIGSLADDAARALLSDTVLGTLDVEVADRVIAESRGNPLVLELAGGATPADLAGGFASVSSQHVEARFRARLEELTPDVCELVLLAAAEPLGNVDLLRAAAGRLGLNLAALAPAEEAGLLELGTRVRFRHPLVRSAVYQAASPGERRRAHGALGEATDPARDPDRRAWHLALSSPGSNEALAAELERAAHRASVRGGAAAAAAFLELAAGATADQAWKASLTLAAARAKSDAGDHGEALRLLDLSQRGMSDELLLAHAQVLRAQIAYRTTRRDTAARLLRDAAIAIAPLDPDAGQETFLEAFAAAGYVGGLRHPERDSKLVQAARRNLILPTEPSAKDLLLEALIVEHSGDDKRAAAASARAVGACLASDEESHADDSVASWMYMTVSRALDRWDLEAGEILATRRVRHARRTGSLATLPDALRFRSLVHTLAGELDDAEALVAEAATIERATGLPSVVYGAAMLAAWRGDRDTIRSLQERAGMGAAARGEGQSQSVIGLSLAILFNGLGRYDAAFAAAQEGARQEEPGVRALLALELVESAVRSDNLDAARTALEPIFDRARDSGTDWAVGLRSLLQALVAGDDRAAEPLYQEAVETLSGTHVLTYLARARLAYGEWLRRAGRRRDAGVVLREAHEQLITIGASAFAARTARELRALGERPRRRTPETLDALTPQELQIARLVAAGETNKEVAAELFLSPRTVDAHLRSVFRKLDIDSRRHLREQPQFAQRLVG